MNLGETSEAWFAREQNGTIVADGCHCVWLGRSLLSSVSPNRCICQ